MKDYYAILGVSLDAEAEVISAAYKALVKKYHPDVYTGTKKDSENRIREINEAYAILSDKSKKEAYDGDFLKNKSTGSFDDFNESEFDDNSDIFDVDWNILIEVYPDAEKLRLDLSNLSLKLGFLFQVVLLDKQLGAKADQAAENLRKNFLERYFGTDKKIQDLAIQALINKDIELAKEINKKITLLGDDAAEKIYNAILSKLDKKKYSTFVYPSFHQSRENNYKKSDYHKTLILFILIGLGLLFFFSNSDYSETGACYSKPTACTDSQICEYATEIVDSKVSWSVSNKNYAETAKSRGLACNVGFQY